MMGVYLIPQGVNIEPIVKFLEAQYGDTEVKHKERLYYIIGTIYSKMLIRDNDSGINLHSKVLKIALGNNYFIYLNSLINHGIIKRVDGYYPGIQSNSFRLILNANRGKAVPFVISNYIVKKAVEKANDYLTKMHVDNLRKSKFLIKQFTNALTIDTTEALKEIELLERTQSDNWSKDKFQIYRQTVDRISKQDWTLNRDTTSYRFHSNLSRLPRFLRKHLRYNGERLHQVDISNSQPYLLIGMMKKEQKILDKRQETGIYKLHEILWKELKDKGIHMCNGVIMCQQSSETIDMRGVDVDDFKRLVISGQLYENIQARFHGKFFEKNCIDRFDSREKTKEEFMEFLYSKPNPNAEASNIEHFAPYKELANVFPNVSRFLKLLKSGNHKHCPILLQKLESHLVLDVCCKELDRLGVRPFFTVHDSIVTTKDNIVTVRIILGRVLREDLGISPSLKLEEWN